MNEDAGKLELVVLSASAFGWLNLAIILRFQHKVVQVQLVGKLVAVVDLGPLKELKVKVDALEVKDQRVRERLDARPLDRRYLGVAAIALILVVTLKDLWLDEGLQRLGHIAFVLDRARQREKVVDACANMLAVLLMNQFAMSMTQAWRPLR